MTIDAVAARARLFRHLRGAYRRDVFQRFDARQAEWMRPRHRQRQSCQVTTFTPTAFTFTTNLAATSYATSTTPNATISLDLTTKFGAWWFPMVGRNAATALTRAAYWAARRSYNSSSTIRLPQSTYDFISSTAAVNQTTVASGGAAGATTMVLTSGTGFAAQQVCLAQLAAARAEWFQIDNLTTATITIDDSAGFKVTHNASDVVTNGADCGAIWLPGGDLWYLTPVNNSGQTLIMAGYSETYASDTGT